MNKFTLLVGIGAQKCGTTWLAEYLNSLDGVVLTPIKELHVFDHKYVYKKTDLKSRLRSRIQHLSEKIRNGFDDIDAALMCAELLKNSVDKYMLMSHEGYYSRYFSSLAAKHCAKVVGEITPAYSLLPKSGFEEIYRTHDDVKFVFLMRDPILRAWSHINYENSRNHLGLGEKEKVGLLLDPFANRYFEKSNYKRTIADIESVVPRAKIFYGFYESMFDDRVLYEMSEFLGVEHKPESVRFDQIVNKNSYRDMPSEFDLSRVPGFYKEVYSFVRGKFGEQVPAQWLL